MWNYFIELYFPFLFASGWYKLKKLLLLWHKAFIQMKFIFNSMIVKLCMKLFSITVLLWKDFFRFFVWKNNNSMMSFMCSQFQLNFSFTADKKKLLSVSHEILFNWHVCLLCMCWQIQQIVLNYNIHLWYHLYNYVMFLS